MVQGGVYTGGLRRTLNERLFFGWPEGERRVILRIVSEDFEEAAGCDGFD